MEDFVRGPSSIFLKGSTTIMPEIQVIKIRTLQSTISSIPPFDLIHYCSTTNACDFPIYLPSFSKRERKTMQ